MRIVKEKDRSETLMKKRIAILSLIGALLGTTAFAYTDLDGYWGAEQIYYLSGKNLISGYPDNTFNPQGKLTREEACAIISRYIGEKKSENNFFNDIDGRWSENYIKHLLNERIVVGYPDGNFNPTDQITRSEFVTMLYRYLRNENLLVLDGPDVEFSDIKDNWAEHYINVLGGMKILNGYPDGTFKPLNLITRGEAAAIITKLERLGSEFNIDPNLPEEKKKEEILKFIQKNYGDSIDIEALRDKSVEEIFEYLGDENSKYMDYNRYQNYISTLKGSFVGIGVHVASNYNNKVQVVDVVDNSPAQEAGIQTGDIIETVDGVAYEGSQVYQVTKTFDGEVGTTLTVGILRIDEAGNEIRETKTLERRNIKVETVFPRMLDDNVGYMKVAIFEEPTYEDFKTYYQDLKNQGAEYLVIDLRYNNGGLVRPARNMVDDLVGPGNLYSTVGKDGNVTVVQSTEKVVDIPYVLIVNEFTASASEIVAAAVKDHGEGKIVGTRTYGKGTVQTVVTLPDGTGFKLTIAEYLSPNGNKIDKVGVQPDYEVDIDNNVENIGPDYLEYDSQLQKAIEVVKGE